MARTYQTTLMTSALSGDMYSVKVVVRSDRDLDQVNLDGMVLARSRKNVTTRNVAGTKSNFYANESTFELDGSDLAVRPDLFAVQSVGSNIDINVLGQNCSIDIVIHVESDGEYNYYIPISYIDIMSNLGANLSITHYCDRGFLAQGI